MRCFHTVIIRTPTMMRQAPRTIFAVIVSAVPVSEEESPFLMRTLCRANRNAVLSANNAGGMFLG